MFYAALNHFQSQPNGVGAMALQGLVAFPVGYLYRQQTFSYIRAAILFRVEQTFVDAQYDNSFLIWRALDYKINNCRIQS